MVEMVDFVGYRSEEWDPQITACPFLFFQSSSVHPNALVEATFEELCINDFSVNWWL